MRTIASILLMTSMLVSCGSAKTTPVAARFPDVVEIAPLDAALSFARTQSGDAVQLLAVGRFGGGKVSAFNLTEALGAQARDPIALFNELGYDTLRARIEAGFREKVIEVPVSELTLPVDLTDAHVAAGTNFAAHAEESEVEDGPFLFAKLVKPTSYLAPVSAADALLDYEVEIAFVTLADAPLPERPAHLGLILANDFTDRAKLLRHVNPDDVASGDGFTTGKSAKGYLPVGNLFVIPRDAESFVRGIELKLAVNGELRQRAAMTLAIWDLSELLRQTEARKDTRWRYGEQEVGLPIVNGALPARTMIVSGTPSGTIFAGISKGTMATGALRWLAGGWGKPASEHVVERYIASAKKQGNFLQASDRVSIHVEKMGTIETSVVK